MRKFLNRALKKIGKLNIDQIRSLIMDVVQENELLEMVLYSMTDGVVVLDEKHSVILLNKAAERLFPFKNGDVVERPLWDALADSSLSEFFHKALVEHENIEDKEISLQTSASTRVLSCTMMPLVREGRIQGGLLHIEDITEKKAKEARLRRAENLAALTTLTAGVAHEIKNPLGSISIHIQLIQKALGNGANGKNTETIQNYLDIVNEEVDRLNGIIVDFLFAVRPMDVNLVAQNLNDLVHELFEFIHYELEEQKIRLEFNLDDRMPELQLDVKYMKQALLNIVKNAISAMPEGGTLRVETIARDDQVELSIRDTGVGIPEENMTKIFEPYFTTKDFGSGLGLTLVYKIIKEHQGEINLESREGEGTTFTITLPVPQKEQRLLGWQSNEV
ncbi:PAS domain-containing sensor histidine kinase [Marispirochaeta aestuarii]|uniref:histidine kinase n=1 Tax=Marispirochaeta aestuarii TaxID=1963862 RepID=A0A1Y1RU01_9SPIO|nr:ATP-binding protein [Marispirochaeta aestuarii]ORC31784.1 PAS domain-containing sensor histidine kinase [Marispirochaeta aestuarii]